MVKINSINDFVNDLVTAVTGVSASKAQVAWAKAEFADTHSFQMAAAHYTAASEAELYLVADLLGWISPSGEPCPFPSQLRDRYENAQRMMVDLFSGYENVQ